ncbi:saccharopine dehydrogenase C-terminal domain-containing protein [Kangiella sediminilitoris]|uniref:Saccharopine dehydrogenase n=1 Tax=Kangiella sediminilitoris TaxID=1144748 RepID=A0A1B3BAF5_9GAMM|nr:saccharopine dehydrogenase C-terminal domain-containing protein [Kangiella sediminilitoris]AOE49768.1 Saccharopine dehydrogenase [Kangiella sediminilitoris]
MSNVIVLGAGMVGNVIARDISEKYDVTVADIDTQTLKLLKKRQPSINTQELNVLDGEALKRIVEPFDIVICAVPGNLGFKTLKNVIEAGKNVVDISFAPENCLELDHLAKKHNVTAVIDSGVAPGMDNLLLGFLNTKMEVTDFECFVGGLPKIRSKPFEYKAPFSPLDVIAEYVRPVHYFENGRELVKEPLTDRELIEFEQIGTLEAFNTDGLRSLIYTMSHIPNMKEKTLRYPGHVEAIRALKQSGFFDSDPVMVNGMEISPIEFTSKVLINEWKLKRKEEEFTIMRIRIRGVENGKRKEYVYDLYDEYDKIKQETSMARTTGFAANAIAGLILKDKFDKVGVYAPEHVGGHTDCCKTVIDYMEERKVRYRLEVNNLD